MRFEAGLPTDHRVGELAVSPDGAFLAYTTDTTGPSRIYVRSLDQLDPIALEETAGAHNPFFSPDGQWLGFFADDKLRTIPVRGGRALDVCDAPVDSAGGSWGVDGQIVFAPLDGRGLVKVDRQGGVPQVLTKVDAAAGEIAHGWPHVLPGGAGVVFTIARKGRDPRMAVLSAQDAAPRLLLPINGPAQYVSSGHLVYNFSGQLFTLSFDLSTLDRRGGPVGLTREVAGSPQEFDGLGFSVFGISREGLLAYLPRAPEDPPNELVWVTRDGSSSPLPNTPAPHRTPRLSPDGSRVALAVSSGPFTRDVWIQELATGRRMKLTTEGSENHSPVWSRDGRDVAFASNRSGPQNIYVQPATTRRGEAGRLLDGAGTHNPSSWGEGATLAFYEVSSTTGRDIWLHEGRGNTRPLVATPANERAPAVSPDGHWLAYTSDASGTDQVYVQSIAGGDPVRVSATGGTEPLWARGGHELFYRHADQMMAVPIFTDFSLRVGTATRLFVRGYERDPGGNLPNYDVAADGRFLMLRRSDPPRDLRIIVNVAGSH